MGLPVHGVIGTREGFISEFQLHPGCPAMLSGFDLRHFYFLVRLYCILGIRMAAMERMVGWWWEWGSSGGREVEIGVVM